MKTCPKLSGKTKDAKEEPDSSVLTERPRTNWQAMKIKIKRPTSCSNLTIKARGTRKRAASCAFTINAEQAMAPLN